MKYRELLFLFIGFILLQACKNNTCPKMDKVVAAYIPDKNKATYISNFGKSFTLNLDNFVTEEYDYLSSCDACKCRKGACIRGHYFDFEGKSFLVQCQISDELYDQKEGIYRENGFFLVELQLAYTDTDYDGDVFNEGGSYKVNFENGIIENINNHELFSNGLRDINLNDHVYNDALILEKENDPGNPSGVWKIVFAKDFGIIAFFTNRGEDWTLKELE